MGPVGDVVVDGFGKGVGFLKDHAHLGPQRHHIDIFIVDVLLVDGDLAGHAAAVDGVVHAVQAADEGGLAAAGRPDHGDHFVAADIEGDILDGVLVAIVDIDIAAGHPWVFDERLPHGLALFAADQPTRLSPSATVALSGIVCLVVC